MMIGVIEIIVIITIEAVISKHIVDIERQDINLLLFELRLDIFLKFGIILIIFYKFLIIKKVFYLYIL